MKNMPPREFASIADMEMSREVMSILQEGILDLTAKIEALSEMGKATPQERQKAGEEYNTYEAAVGKDQVSAEFEDAEFNYFFNLFGQHGKEWFNTVDEFLTFNKQMNETNSAPKVKKTEK
jgi:hypothetical protein